MSQVLAMMLFSNISVLYSFHWCIAISDLGWQCLCSLRNHNGALEME